MLEVICPVLLCMLESVGGKLYLLKVLRGVGRVRGVVGAGADSP